MRCLSLALGIGANTAIFNLWNGVLHASLPIVAQPDQLVMLTNPDEAGSWTGGWNGRTDGPRSWVTYEEFEQLRDQADRFSSMMASQSNLSTWQIRFQGDGWEEGRGRLVSGGFFEVLGVRPAIGRLFTAADDRLDVPHAVISHAYWRRRFGGTARRAGQDVPGPQRHGDRDRRDAGGLCRRDQRSAAGLLVADPTAAARVAWQGSPARHAAGQVDVAARVRTVEAGRDRAEAEAQANAILQANLAAFYGNTLRAQRRQLSRSSG